MERESVLRKETNVEESRVREERREEGHTGRALAHIRRDAGRDIGGDKPGRMGKMK